MNVSYGVIEEKYTADGQARTWYGIAAYSDLKQCGTGAIIASVHEITGDLEQITELVKKCNDCHLSVEHLVEVIEDFLAQ